VSIHGGLKSLSQYRDIWLSLAKAGKNSPYVCDKDIKTFVKRLESEGISYLTKTLPTIGKALDSSFENGWKCPEFFSKQKDSDIPIFLGKAIKLALGGDSAAVACVRQLAYTFYKLETDFNPTDVNRLLDEFKLIDASLPSFDDLNKLEIVKKARTLIHEVLCNLDPMDIRPKHSNGATSCRTKNSDKYAKLRYSPKLDTVYSYSDYFFLNYDHFVDEMKRLIEAEELDPCARVCLVPKDSRGPRIISCEPAEFMFIQQGIMNKMYEGLSVHPLTRGLVNFTDQEVNRHLARHSSITRDLATLDLSEASDRVSLGLVRALFPSNWYECLTSCRSEQTLLPDGNRVVLNKFAPMGSSCCFPVEALIFWAISTAATINVQFSTPPNLPYLLFKKRRGGSIEVRNSVYVYGDDIICPAVAADIVISALEQVGLKVNLGKCYIDGPFRESCGGDYHNGYDVAPLRFRQPFDGSPTSQISHISFLNLFYEKFGPCDALREIFEAEYGAIPDSAVDIPLTVRVKAGVGTNLTRGFRRRFNKRLHRHEYRVQQPSTRSFAAREPDWIELFRKSLERGVVHKFESEEVKASKGLKPGEYVVPRSMNLSWKWTWLG